MLTPRKILATVRLPVETAASDFGVGFESMAAVYHTPSGPTISEASRQTVPHKVVGRRPRLFGYDISYRHDSHNAENEERELRKNLPGSPLPVDFRYEVGSGDVDEVSRGDPEQRQG